MGTVKPSEHAFDLDVVAAHARQRGDDMRTSEAAIRIERRRMRRMPEYVAGWLRRSIPDMPAAVVLPDNDSTQLEDMERGAASVISRLRRREPVDPFAFNYLTRFLGLADTDWGDPEQSRNMLIDTFDRREIYLLVLGEVAMLGGTIDEVAAKFIDTRPGPPIATG